MTCCPKASGAMVRNRIRVRVRVVTFIVVASRLLLAVWGSSVERSLNAGRPTVLQCVAKTPSISTRLAQRCLLRCLSSFVRNPWGFDGHSAPPPPHDWTSDIRHRSTSETLDDCTGLGQSSSRRSRSQCRCRCSAPDLEPVLASARRSLACPMYGPWVFRLRYWSNGGAMLADLPLASTNSNLHARRNPLTRGHNRCPPSLPFDVRN